MAIDYLTIFAGLRCFCSSFEVKPRTADKHRHPNRKHGHTSAHLLQDGNVWGMKYLSILEFACADIGFTAGLSTWVACSALLPNEWPNSEAFSGVTVSMALLQWLSAWTLNKIIFSQSTATRQRFCDILHSRAVHARLEGSYCYVQPPDKYRVCRKYIDCKRKKHIQCLLNFTYTHSSWCPIKWYYLPLNE